MSNPPFELTAELQQAVSSFFERIPFNKAICNVFFDVII